MLRNVGATLALVVPAVVTTVLASSTNCLVALDAQKCVSRTKCQPKITASTVPSSPPKFSLMGSPNPG